VAARARKRSGWSSDERPPRQERPMDVPSSTRWSPPHAQGSRHWFIDEFHARHLAGQGLRRLPSGSPPGWPLDPASSKSAPRTKEDILKKLDPCGAAAPSRGSRTRCRSATWALPRLRVHPGPDHQARGALNFNQCFENTEDLQDQVGPQPRGVPARNDVLNSPRNVPRGVPPFNKGVSRESLPPSERTSGTCPSTETPSTSSN